MKYLSLFSGIGGFELGIQQAYENISGSTGDKQGWVEGKEISDTQRYKTLGNAVTVNVIRDIFQKILTQ